MNKPDSSNKLGNVMKNQHLKTILIYSVHNCAKNSPSIWEQGSIFVKSPKKYKIVNQPSQISFIFTYLLDTNETCIYWKFGLNLLRHSRDIQIFAKAWSQGLGLVYTRDRKFVLLISCEILEKELWKLAFLSIL